MWDKSLQRLEPAAEHIVAAAVDIAPPLLVAFLLPLLVSRFVNFSEASSRLALVEMCFFAFLGVLVAYLTNLSKDTVLQTLLPSLIVLYSESLKTRDLKG